MEKFENEHFLTYVEDNIVFMVYKKREVLEVETVKLAVAKRLELTGPNITLPLFIDFRNPLGGTKQTRKYLSSEESIKGLSAGAILINSYPAMMAYNLYMKIDKPPLTMKAFVHKEKALKWLEQFKTNLN